jgi:hypothetical protein
MLKEGWKDASKVFALAIVLDLIYQIVVLRFFYPGEAIIVAAALALIPYSLVRPVVNRLASRRQARP